MKLFEITTPVGGYNATNAITVKGDITVKRGWINVFLRVFIVTVANTSRGGGSGTIITKTKGNYLTFTYQNDDDVECGPKHTHTIMTRLLICSRLFSR